jgi:hypothetical protein
MEGKNPNPSQLEILEFTNCISDCCPLFLPLLPKDNQVILKALWEGEILVQQMCGKNFTSGAKDGGMVWPSYGSGKARSPGPLLSICRQTEIDLDITPAALTGRHVQRK